MAENVEEIEAKLAAYVDGELTPAERVEIETYLQSNPSHRALLQDLVLHRNLLRGLPREKAPGDCTEGFQGQLERDILLGGDELSRARRRFRIHYSPQLLSAAAIILVAVALGIIVYTVLPPHQPHAPIAQLSTEPNKTAEPALTEGRSDPLGDARSYKGAPADVMSKKSGESNLLALKDEALGQKVDTARYAAFKTQAEQQPIAAGDMMVITVTADDVKGANEAVVSYLALNKIKYTAEAEGFWKDGVDALAAGRRLAGGMGVPGGAGGAGQGGGAPAAGAELDSLTAAQLPALRANEDQVAKREEALERGRLVAPRPDAKAEFKAASGKQDEKRLAEQVLADKDQPQREERFSKLAARPAAIQPQATGSPTTQPSAVALSGTDRQGINDTVNAKIGGGGSASAAGAVLLR